MVFVYIICLNIKKSLVTNNGKKGVLLYMMGKKRINFTTYKNWKKEDLSDSPKEHFSIGGFFKETFGLGL
jgi:hypothetical protein